ncbi:MAG: caspase family protein [Magnetococcales bacterium]|nr:caspase family protein [Magnetococcales bacterium]
MNKPLSALALSLFLAGASLPDAALAADLYGFVIGVNDYQHQTKLDGAINDARDIAAALRQAGAKEVVELLDRKADRDTVFAKWKELISHTKKGDVLVFTYAGHGAQEPEHVKGSETDGRDENFLLADFNVEGKSTYQRIVDDEIGVMLREDAAHLKVLFVADSCHSGTMTRSFSSAPKKTKHRFVPPIIFKDDALKQLYTSRAGDVISKPLPAPAGMRGDASPDALPPTVFGISAVADHELDPEIMTDDKPRGALSVAVAKAFRGAADTNKDGNLSKGELEHYVKENVRMLVDGQQHPQFSGGGDDFSLPISGKKGGETAAKPEEKQKSPAKETAAPALLKLHVTGIPAGLPEDQWRPHLTPGIQVVDSPQQAQVIWNMTEERIVSQLGDELYNGKQPQIAATRAFKRAGTSAVPTVDISYANQVFDKLLVVERIKQRSAAKSPTMALKPNDKIHRNGERVTLETSGQHHPFLTLFNIASDGVINYLYPIDDGKIKDPLQIPVNQPHTLDLNVEPPFGADHFVVILSEKPLTGLHADLQGMNGKKLVTQLEASLDRHLKGANHQIGIHGVYTGP